MINEWISSSILLNKITVLVERSGKINFPIRLLYRFRGMNSGWRIVRERGMSGGSWYQSINVTLMHGIAAVAVLSTRVNRVSIKTGNYKIHIIKGNDASQLRRLISWSDSIALALPNITITRVCNDHEVDQNLTTDFSAELPTELPTMATIVTMLAALG